MTRHVVIIVAFVAFDKNLFCTFSSLLRPLVNETCGESCSSRTTQSYVAAIWLQQKHNQGPFPLSHHKEKVFVPEISLVQRKQQARKDTMSEANQGRRANASSGPLMDTDKKLIGGDSFLERTKDPEWLKVREEVYAKIKARREEEFSKKIPVDITVTMPDGNILDKDKEGAPYQAWRTTPYDVAKTISQGLADASAVARVTYEKYVEDYSSAEDGMEGADTLMDAMEDLSIEEESKTKAILWDMTRPLVGPVAKLELLKFESDQDAKTVFWHSSAHMLGEALENLYGCKLTIGPPLAGGFYYDSYMGTDAFREDDCKCELYEYCLTDKCALNVVLEILHLHFIYRQTGRATSSKDCQAKAKIRANGSYQGGSFGIIC